MEPEAILWHTNVDLEHTKAQRKQYHISILDGEETINIIVNYGPNKSLTVEHFVLHEMDYTVHDFCNHEADYCVLDDPDSFEYQDMILEQEYHRLVASRRRQIAEELLQKQKEVEQASGSSSPAEREDQAQ